MSNQKVVVLNAAKMNYDGLLDFSILSPETIVYDDSAPEEIISRDYIAKEKPDAIINIVDASNLERNLYLTTQVMEMDTPVVVALNMMDIVRKNGDDIKTDKLEKELGVPVVEISALKG